MQATQTSKQPCEMDTFTKAIRIVALGAVLIMLTGMALHARSRDDFSAHRRHALIQMHAFVELISLYRLDTGSFPVTLQDLRERPCDAHGWRGPYIATKIPVDPWGNHYRYELKGRRPRLASAGPDGNWGTDDDV